MAMTQSGRVMKESRVETAMMPGEQFLVQGDVLAEKRGHGCRGHHRLQQDHLAAQGVQVEERPQRGKPPASPRAKPPTRRKKEAASTRRSRAAGMINCRFWPMANRIQGDGQRGETGR